MPGSARSGAGSVNTFNGSVFTGSDVTVTKPSGVVDGDLLVAVGYCDPGWTLSPPDGTWTEIESVAGSSRNGKVWTKVAASEPSSYTFPLSAGGHGHSIAVGVAAFESVGAVEDSSITEASSGTSATAPAVTTGGADRFVLFFGLIQSNGSNLDPGAGWTSLLSVSESGGPASTQDGLTIYYKHYASAGSTGTVGATAASAWGGHVCGLVAFPDTNVVAEWYVGSIRGVA